MFKSTSRIGRVIALSLLVTFIGSCKSDSPTGSQSSVEQFGSSGDSHTVQCSGWFPDWISPNPPPIADAFQLSQGYPLGKPILNNSGLVGWEPLDPPQNRPWMAFDYKNPAQSENYAKALLNYAFAGLRHHDWNPNRQHGSGLLQNPIWFHAPFMHTSIRSRREPLKGVTAERVLRDGENSWLSDSLRTYAIGYYDYTAGYTLGQIYNDPDPARTNPHATEFIGNAYIFKLIFAEYDPSKIIGDDPLANSPEWQIQDVMNPNGSLINIRLIQVDIAVKDPRAAADTGWVFATYAYDKSLTPKDGDPWRRLQTIGLQWGADPDAPPFGTGSLQESWINPNLLQIWADRLGRGGRLNGPIDDPASSCISCHSTAQIDPNVQRGGGTDLIDFSATRMAPDSCAINNLKDWYRNFSGQEVFGDYDRRCTPVPNSDLISLDYSLQVMVGLQSALYYKNGNPCAAIAENNMVKSAKSDTIETMSQEAGKVTKTRQSQFLFDRSREVPTLQLDYSDQIYSNKDGMRKKY